jgi:hypothetical protein
MADARTRGVAWDPRNGPDEENRFERFSSGREKQEKAEIFVGKISQKRNEYSESAVRSERNRREGEWLRLWKIVEEERLRKKEKQTGKGTEDLMQKQESPGGSGTPSLMKTVSKKLDFRSGFRIWFRNGF